MGPFLSPSFDGGKKTIPDAHLEVTDTIKHTPLPASQLTQILNLQVIVVQVQNLNNLD